MTPCPNLPGRFPHLLYNVATTILFLHIPAHRRHPRALYLAFPMVDYIPSSVKTAIQVNSHRANSMLSLSVDDFSVNWVSPTVGRFNATDHRLQTFCFIGYMPGGAPEARIYPYGDLYVPHGNAVTVSDTGVRSDTTGNCSVRSLSTSLSRPSTAF
jgi:hypothetical protein